VASWPGDAELADPAPTAINLYHVPKLVYARMAMQVNEWKKGDGTRLGKVAIPRVDLGN